MQKVLSVALFSVMLATTSFTGLAQDKATASQADNFSSKLFQQIAKNKPQENFVVSGESLESVLLMLQYGATGLTQHELSQALCGNSQSCDSDALNAHEGYLAANAVWLQQEFTIKADYRADIEKRFHGDIETVDFQTKKAQAVEQINAWAAKNTEGMIKEVLKASDVDSMTAMVLANALYFQGFWPTEFDPAVTAEREFSLLDGKKTQVPTMMKKDHYFLAKHNNIQLIGLPYRDTNLEMLVLMPDDPKKFQLFVRTLSNETLQILAAKQEKVESILFLPKFSITSSYDDLKSTLKALGIRKVFSLDAELNKISDKAPLYLSKVLQKAVIQVDEHGTKAAAVTAGVVAMRSALINEIEINRPFVFAIYDQKSHKIPFIGQVVNPAK